MILKKMKEAGLEKESEIQMFKAWIFEWPKWNKGIKAEKLCKDFSSLTFLDYCEPDYLLGPAGKKK